MNQAESIMNNKLTLMIQGTTSDAGKSFLVAALCRYFSRLGEKVAPFKPQNMALNSAVTEEGGEIGRAQALQAQACKIEAHTDMNPILLKPSSDTGAQVIVHGKALTAMDAAAYHDYKKHAMQAVLESHSRLIGKYDIVVVEGAGSPAEINLREGDIANMGFAEEVDCPVIIVADIDKGGVFAHLVGTLELLSESEQSRVVGFVINRFRGDIALLQSGLEWLERKTGKPVVGVIPYLKEFYLDAEDAIDTKQLNTSPSENKLKVVVPVYPRISNHTDLDALRLHPDVNLEFIAPGKLPHGADLIILPGSKNVRADLEWLKGSEWPAFIERHLRYGGKLIGVCGGYQMLGELISDPHGIEGPRGQSLGLGYLPINTELHERKITELKRGKLKLGARSSDIEGYEIHCGVSSFTSSKPNLIDYGDTVEGFVSSDQQILGTYLHGLFDSSAALNALINWAGQNSGSEGFAENSNLNDIRETQLERIADTVEKYIDWAKFWSAIVKKNLPT